MMNLIIIFLAIVFIISISYNISIFEHILNENKMPITILDRIGVALISIFGNVILAIYFMLYKK
jgi:hypothetical protein